MIMVWWVVLIGLSSGQVVDEMPLSMAPIPGNDHGVTLWQDDTPPGMISRAGVECHKIVGTVVARYNLKNQDRVWARCELRVMS